MTGGALAPRSVPAADSALNLTIEQVVGNKSDTHSGNSIAAVAKRLDEHAHTASRCYPTLADGVVVAGAAGAWALGAFVEIVPASTITSDFDIHFISIEAISANDIYQLELYEGTTFRACVRFVKNAGLTPTIIFPVISPIFAANAQVQAKLATSGGGADTATISILYHTY
jgi:hypothetical protein